MTEPHRTLAAAVLLTFSLATAVCFVSNNLNSRRQHLDETVAQQIALISGAPLVFDGQPSNVPEFRNRVLFPFVMVGVARATELADREAFLLVRWLSAVLCFGTLLWFAIVVVGNDVAASALAALLLAMFFVVSFNHPWEHPTDFPDATAMVLGAWAAIRRRVWPAVIVAAVAAANRESAAFIGVLWIAVTTRDDASRPKRVMQGMAIMLVAVSVTLALRLVFDMRSARVVNSIAGNSVSAMLATAANRPFMSWLMLLVASLAPALAVIGATWPRVSAVGRRIIVAGLCVAAASLVIGSPEEIRIIAPAAAMLVCGLVVSDIRESQPNNGSRSLTNHRQ